MAIKLPILLVGLISALGFSGLTFENKKDEYIFAFYRIDNRVEIIVNDSLVYSTREMEGNPNLEGKLTYKVGHLLSKDKRDEVIVRLYNGHEPYDPEKKDRHWEIEYSLIKNGQEYDLMWNEGDDYRTGLVFEEKYYL